MNHKQLLETLSDIKKNLSINRISAAISVLENMAITESSSWNIREDIAKIKESYGYLCRYALDGVDDPGRNSVLDNIKESITSIAETIIRQSLSKTSPMQYYSTLRFENIRSDSSIRGLLENYRKDIATLGMASFSGQNDVRLDDGSSLRRSLEDMSMRIFKLVWTTYPMSEDDESALSDALNDDAFPQYFKEHILSAIMLGNLHYYDERRMILLGNTYMSGGPQLDIKALCALLLCMWMCRDSISGKRFTDMLASLRECPQWNSDLKMLFLDYAKTRDTERISRTMTEEVIPTMMKLRPDLNKKISDSMFKDDISATEFNPEWEDLLEKSGVADKLKELNDIQADGGDVMMSTFAHLKNFPFFNDIANWFLPFYPEYSSVSDIFGSPTSELLTIIAGNPLMCDGDKYSLIMSLQSVPEQHRRMLLEQFKSQGIDLMELHKSELNPESVSRSNVANKYVQDLYRFFNLYRRKGEFNSPFANPINLAGIHCLSEDFKDTDIIRAVAEFYFKRGYYTEAYDLFRVIMDKTGHDAQMLQKAGYCMQQTGDIAQALDYYQKSELLNPDNIWTLRRIAQCHRLMGDSVKAMDYYRRVVDAKPSDLGATLCLGHCLMDNGLYKDALNCYFKVEFLDENSHKAMRPIAWCSFLAKDFERSRQYYENILESQPTAIDYFNAGHMYMALNDYRKAREVYVAGVKAEDDGTNKYDDIMTADRPYLEAAGVDGLIIDLMIDSVLSGC